MLHKLYHFWSIEKYGMSQNTLDDVYIYIWTISFDIIYRTIFGALAFNFDLSFVNLYPLHILFSWWHKRSYGSLRKNCPISHDNVGQR